MNGPSTLIGWAWLAPLPKSTAAKPSSGFRVGSGDPNSTAPTRLWSEPGSVPSVPPLPPVPPPTAMRGAVPAPSVPPVAAAVRPPEMLTSDAPMRMPATATATARSCPSRQRRGRRGSPTGRSTDERRLADGHQPRGHDHRVDPALHLACGSETPDLEAPGAGAAVFLWSAQTSDDALDANRCIQQYGLPGVGRSWGAGGSRGLAGFRPSGSRFRAGVLSSRPSPVSNGLTTSAGTVTRT